MSDDLAMMLGERFIARRDVKAFQNPNGGYFVGTTEPYGKGERSPIKRNDLRRHVAGEVSLGHYLVNQEDRCKLFAFDIDLRKEGFVNGDDPFAAPDEDPRNSAPINPREEWLRETEPCETDTKRMLRTALRCMAEGLAARTHRLTELPVAAAYSGRKGLHVYCFTGEVPASEARGVAEMVLESYGCFERTKGQVFWGYDDPKSTYANLEIEVFPKQGNLEGKDLGNLMRLPLGRNAVTGHRSHFIWFGARTDIFEEMDPMQALNGRLPWPT